MANNPPTLVVDWPPQDVYPLLRLIALLALAHAWGLVIHILTSGPTFTAEIVSGFVLGPQLTNIVPFTDALQFLGQIGLYVVTFERALHVHLEVLAEAPLPALLLGLLGSAVPMTLAAVALATAGIPFVEAVCGGAVLAPAVVGNVDVGWLRVNLEELCPRAAIVGKILAGAGAVNTVFALIAVSVVGSVQPGWYWWSLTQPVLFALALVVVGLLFRKLLAAVCCVQLEGLFGGARAPRGGTEPRFVAYDVLLLAAMVAFGLGLAVLAEMVQVSPLLGLFVGGLVFSNIPSAKSRWLQGTRNSSHWASRVFFAATIGFLVPITMWTDANVVWTGLLVGGAAFMGRIVAGLLGSAPALLRSPVGIAGVMQVTAGATLQGEIGFFVLFELFSLGRISDRALGPLLWALMANSLIAPLFFQLTVWVFARAGAADDFADAAGFVPAEGVPSGSLPMYERSYTHSAAGALGGEFALQPDMPGAGKAAQFRESMHKYAASSPVEMSAAQQGWHVAPAGGAEHHAAMLESEAGVTSPGVSVTSQIRRQFKPLWQDDD